MTVSTTLDRQTFPGDGVNKNFPFNFRFLDNDQIQVSIIAPDGTETALVRNVDYTLTGVLEQNGGQVTTTVAPPLTSPVTLLLVQRVLPATQPTSIRNQGKFFPEVHENAFDRLTMLIQQAISAGIRSLKLNSAGTAWDFKGLRGVNAADPTAPQDVTTRNWVQQYIAQIISSGQGNPNTAANVLFVKPDGSIGNLQQLSGPGGGSFIGWQRAALSSQISTVGQMLSAQAVNIWEYANLITTKPTPSNPATWDWTPALQAALNSVGSGSLPPVGPNACVVVPAGRYRITSVSVPPHAVIYASGAVFVPLLPGIGANVNNYAAGVTFSNTSQTTRYNGYYYRPKDSALPFTTTNWATDASKFELRYMFVWGGFNRAYDVVVDMSWSMIYDCAHWVRSRHNVFNGCDVWRAQSGWVFGDPLWRITPANGHLGDSENVMTACATVWCVNAVRAYGQNTILHFNDCLPYSYKPAMSEFDPTNPNLTAWNALPERTFINCGALIYINGGAAANFSGVHPLLYSQIQPVTLSPYVNSFGRYYLANTHVETGFLLDVEPVGAYPPADDFTNILHVNGSNGYVSSTAGNFISLGADCAQAVVVKDCNFYGQTNNNIVYANHPFARVHIDPESFRNITLDFFECMHGRRLTGYPDLCLANVTGCSVSFNSSTPRAPVMPSREKSDIWTAYESLWYNTTTGAFVAQSNVRNARFDISITYPAGTVSDVTSFILKVDGTQVDVKNGVGAIPTVSLRAARIPLGSLVTIEVTCSASRASSGLANSRMVVLGNT